MDSSLRESTWDTLLQGIHNTVLYFNLIIQIRCSDLCTVRNMTIYNWWKPKITQCQGTGKIFIAMHVTGVSYIRFFIRVLIRRQEPGSSTRILLYTRVDTVLYLRTFKVDIKSFTSSDLFCPPTRGLSKGTSNWWSCRLL